MWLTGYHCCQKFYWICFRSWWHWLGPKLDPRVLTNKTIVAAANVITLLYNDLAG